MTRRLLVVAAITLVGWLGLALPASAHPLGNFSVNQYDGLVVSPDAVNITHVIDLAEIPTVQALPAIDANDDGTESQPELDTYADRRCEQDAGAVDLSVGGNAVTVKSAASSAVLSDGQAGLSTLRISCDLRGATSFEVGASLQFTAVDVSSDVGWREVTMQGDGVVLVDADVPTTSLSAELTEYPSDREASPLQVSRASATLALGGSALETTAPPAASGTGLAPWAWGSELLGRVSAGSTGPIGMSVALVVALVVGATHALAPGHGKSLVAFALAGRRERPARAALTVGATVTATHTASVLVLGLVVAGAAATVPAALYRVLGVLIGIVVVVTGAVLLRSALQHDHSHGYGHDHSHGYGHGHPHGHGHGHPHGYGHGPEGAATTSTMVRPITSGRESGATPEARHGLLVTLGVTGGLLPSPSAVVVLLAAVAAGRAWFGVLLVLAFGAGMALTLSAVGFAVLRGQGRLVALAERSPHPRLSAAIQRLPLVTASAVLVVGVLILMRELL